MPAPNERSDGTPMIVDHSQIPEDTAVGQIAALEKDLFGRGAWSEHPYGRNSTLRHARICSTLKAMPYRRRIPSSEYAGYWYDGDDAEIMTIGVGRPYQRQG